MLKNPSILVLNQYYPPDTAVSGLYAAEICAGLAAAGGCRFVWVLHDIHPDILAVSGWRLPRPMVWAWEVANRAAFRRAETVVVLSDDMKRTLVERKGVPEGKVRVIPVWGIPEVAPAEHPRDPRDEWGTAEDELLLLTSGNMGVMHPLDEILDAAGRLAERPVRFVFTGEGVQRRRLEIRAAAEKIGRAPGHRRHEFAKQAGPPA